MHSIQFLRARKSFSIFVLHFDGVVSASWIITLYSIQNTENLIKIYLTPLEIHIAHLLPLHKLKKKTRNRKKNKFWKIEMKSNDEKNKKVTNIFKSTILPFTRVLHHPSFVISLTVSHLYFYIINGIKLN